ncbi:MAG: methyltransferase domain-containing protein [Pseudomonadota bacterium]
MSGPSRLDPDTAAQWDGHAKTYAQLFAPLTGHIARSMLGLIEARLPPAPRILDIACGPGDLAVAAARLCADRRGGGVLATDLSPEMVALTQRALEPLSAYARAEVRDGEALGLSGAGFDAALSCFGIFLFPDRRAGWRAAVEALKPEGIFATSMWRGPGENELGRVQAEALFAALPGRLMDPPPRPDWARLMAAEELVGEVTSAAPLADAEIHIVEATIAVPTPAAMTLGMIGNPVTGALIAECAPDERLSLEAALTATFERRAGGPDRPLVLNASCNVLVARRM